MSWGRVGELDDLNEIYYEIPHHLKQHLYCIQKSHPNSSLADLALKITRHFNTPNASAASLDAYRGIPVLGFRLHRKDSSPLTRPWPLSYRKRRPLEAFPVHRSLARQLSSTPGTFSGDYNCDPCRYPGRFRYPSNTSQ